MKHTLTFLAALLITSFKAVHAAELRFAGTLGNSDDSQSVFAGKLAAGIGPVLDNDSALWERSGSTRLNRVRSKNSAGCKVLWKPEVEVVAAKESQPIGVSGSPNYVCDRLGFGRFHNAGADRAC